MQNIDRHVDLWELFPFTPEVGYLGLTIVSFFGSLIPFVPIPSFVLVATMAVGEQFDIHVLVVIAAINDNAWILNCTPSAMPATKMNDGIGTNGASEPRKLPIAKQR